MLQLREININYYTISLSIRFWLVNLSRCMLNFHEAHTLIYTNKNYIDPAFNLSFHVFKRLPCFGQFNKQIRIKNNQMQDNFAWKAEPKSPNSLGVVAHLFRNYTLKCAPVSCHFVVDSSQSRQITT